MKKTLIIILSFFTISNVMAQSNLPDTLFLRNKTYYQSIFNKTEIAELNEAFELREKANKFYNEYSEFLNKAHEYEELAKKTTLKQKKFNRKSQKYKVKADKLGNKCFDLLLESDEIIEKNYHRKLSFFVDYKKNKKLIFDLNTEISYYRDSLNNVDKYLAKNKLIGNEVFKKSYIHYYKNQILLTEEYQFSVYKEDMTIINELLKPKKDSLVSDTTINNTVVTNNNFNAKDNKFLYYPHNEELDLKLSYKQQELNAIQQYYKKGKQGFETLNNTTLLKDSIFFYDLKIRNENNISILKKLEAKKAKIQKKLAYDSLIAINNYYMANENYFLARIGHLHDYKSPDTNTQKKVDNFFELSDKYLKSSQYCMKNPDSLPFDTLYAYKVAVQQLITALEYQENGFTFLIFSDTTNIIPKYKLIFKDTTKKVVDTDTIKTKTNTTTTKTTTTQPKSTGKISGLYVYSYDHPKPVKATTPKGTIYRVQVGISKYNLPVNELKEYDKIYFETVKGSEYNRYLVGDWEDIAVAKNNLRILKTKGYKAKIVKYVDGKRTGAVYTSTYTPVVNQVNTQYNAIDITTTKYLIYFVQIGTFSSPKTEKELNNPGKLYYQKLNDNKIQYFVGPYYRYNLVEQKLKTVKTSGYKDAIVVAYNNGKPITISSARKIEANVQQTNEVVFRVQIGAFSDYLTDTQYKQKYSKVLDLYKIYKYKDSSLIVYSAGNAKTIEQARNIKQILVNMGFTDAFIVAFKGGVKVPLSTVTN